MIRTYTYKQVQKLKDKVKKERRHTSWNWLFILAFLTFVLGILLLTAKEADGEQAPIIASKAEETQEQIITQEEVEATPQRVVAPLDGDKQAIADYIVDVFTEAGYKAPLFALSVAKCESGLSSSAVGDRNSSFGIWQIHCPVGGGCSRVVHPDITKDEALDPVISTNWAVKKFTAGGAGIWTCARLLADS